MAFVLGEMAASTALGSILKVFGSTSTKTGFRRNKEITSTVAAKVKSVVIISSPGSSFKPIKAI